MKSSIPVQVFSGTIVVASGAGSAKFEAVGAIDFVAIKPPSGAPTLTFTLSDADGYVIYTKASMATAGTQEVNKVCSGVTTLAISSATGDGDYTFKVYVRGGI